VGFGFLAVFNVFEMLLGFPEGVVVFEGKVLGRWLAVVEEGRSLGNLNPVQKGRALQSRRLFKVGDLAGVLARLHV